ncbi:MAG: hypothetical protein IPJ69_05645 [Deltaproteobacteria bacterium]|nr:MAG: hypothetical protein IPJ69_05645 [Deltaproteobacteria bacterium]
MLKGLDDFLNDATDRGHVVGTWGFHSNIDFTRMRAEETNVWFFEQIFNFLRAFFGMVLPDSLELITYNASQRFERKGLDQMTFLDDFMLLLKKVKEPLWTARLNLNVIGFLRTAHEPDKPVRLQIQEPTSFIVWGGPDETGFQNFSIGYNLFSTTNLTGEHMALWSMNQPLLEKALRKWEDQTGRMIEVVDSNAGLPMQQYGFQQPKQQPSYR